MWASCEELLIVFGHHETHGGENHGTELQVIEC